MTGFRVQHVGDAGIDRHDIADIEAPFGLQRFAKCRDSLLTCVTDRTVPPTNNASEQDIRPSTIFRKVTNGFRSTWGRDLYAGVRSVLNTARRQHKSAFAAISDALAGRPLFDTG